MTTDLDRALASVDGYQEARAALDRLLTRISTLKPVDSAAAEQAVADEALALAAAGKALPTDLGARLVATRGLNDAYAAETALLQNLREKLHRSVDGTIRDGHDGALTALAARLDAVFADVRASEEALQGARTEREIMRLGSAAVDAWNALDALLPRYVEIRAAQNTIVSAAFGKSLPYGTSRIHSGPASVEAGRLVQFVGEFANPFDVLPEYGWDASRMEPRRRPAPWPDGDPRGTNPPEVVPAQRRYSVAYLRWAANPTGGARVWLPTVAQMEEAESVNRAAIDERQNLAIRAHMRSGTREFSDYTPEEYAERRPINTSTPGEYPAVAEALDKIQLPKSFTA